jgi:hypothetical protein
MIYKRKGEEKKSSQLVSVSGGGLDASVGDEPREHQLGDAVLA